MNYELCDWQGPNQETCLLAKGHETTMMNGQLRFGGLGHLPSEAIRSRIADAPPSERPY